MSETQIRRLSKRIREIKEGDVVLPFTLNSMPVGFNMPWWVGHATVK